MSSSSTGRMTRSASASSARSIRATRTGLARDGGAAAAGGVPALDRAHLPDQRSPTSRRALPAASPQPPRRARADARIRPRPQGATSRAGPMSAPARPRRGAPEAGGVPGPRPCLPCLLPRARVPARYASGYLFTSSDNNEMAKPPWVEACRRTAPGTASTSPRVRAAPATSASPSGSTISMRARYAHAPRRRARAHAGPRLRHRRSAGSDQQQQQQQ